MTGGWGASHGVRGLGLSTPPPTSERAEGLEVHPEARESVSHRYVMMPP